MISTDEMSSTSMDISETFRPEDLSKTDFFDFVNATEMGIGVAGVGGLSLQAQQHHSYQQDHHHHHHHHHHQQQHHQQQQQNHDRLSTNSNMTHDGGGTTGRGLNDVSSNSLRNGNNSDPTLPNYEFWHTDKETSRLDASIFEDLDRYCWQQQQQASSASTQQQQHLTPANQQTTTTNSNNSTSTTLTAADANGSTAVASILNCDSSAAATATNSNSTRTTTATHSANTTGGAGGGGSGGGGGGNNGSNSNANSDGQMYTITVLNGGSETSSSAATPSWMKREPEDTQLPTSIDLDSLLGNFSGYIKSEYPYDDSGFSTDGTKEAINNGDTNSLSIQQQQQQHQQETSSLHVMSNFGGPGGGGGGGGGNSSTVAVLGNGTGQTLPSLVTTMSGGRACVNIGQQLAAAQFQNNNNDWHMIDHNAEQNSAESLLRSALQGKGYTKGLHHMHNGGMVVGGLMPTSPTNKDDEMRRILFPTEADSLAFADSTLNTAQIFDESPQHHANLIQLHNSTTAGNVTANGPMSQSSHGTNSSSLMVDDMFLSLENAFSDDFDKMKRLASEVQQYCNTSPVDTDYIGSNIMMQISPTPVGAAAVGSTTASQMQPLHSPVTTTPPNLLNIIPPPTSPLATAAATTHPRIQQQQQQQQQQQHHKPEVTSVATTTSTSSTNNRISMTKTTKKYKRVSSTTTNHATNNANSLNAINNNNNNSSSSSNNNTTTTTATKNPNSTANSCNSSSKSNAAPSSGGSSSSSSNSPPTANCNGQRKERSLHYCSICSKGFKDKYSVNVHIRTHTGEKPFACSLCGKSFRQKAHLAKHYQTHMAQKNNHGTGIIKSNPSKHHRTSSTAVQSNSAAAAAAAAAAAVSQQRQLSLLASSNTMVSPISINNGSSGSGMGLGINPNLLGVTSAVVTLNGPTNSVGLATNVLPPPNSLMANR